VTLESPLFIVMNTGSGSRDAAVTEATIRGVLAQAGRRHNFWRAHDPRQLPMLAQRAVDQARQQQGVVVAAGGDGTINAVAQGQLAAIAVRPVGLLAMVWLLLRGALGRLGDADNVVNFVFERLTVWPYGRRIKVAMDGEVAWLDTPLVFQVAPHPLPLLVPARNIPASTAAAKVDAP
jgi:diacylglycerol kinase family enzyme